MAEKCGDMQPPPRKLKLGQELRTVQNEQLSNLHAKFQQESDLLEEIRDFSKQRSTIERTYAQSLQKLAAQFQQKRVFPAPIEDQQENEQHRLALQVWKAVLDETEKISKARLTASETLSSQVAEIIKMQKSNRVQVLKKCDETFNICQDELQTTIRELSKCKKNYCDTEALAEEAREKALDAETKLKKGSLKFFQSKSALERQMSKLSARRETCERRSAHMRNEYLLSIGAANSHQQRYYTEDLPYIMTTLDGNFYDRLKDYYSIFATTEIELGTYARACFDKVQGETELVSRNYHLQRFLKKCPVFTELLQYHYTPLETDQISSMVIDQKESLYLDREARKWATEVARQAKCIQEKIPLFQEVQNSMVQLKGSDTSSDSGFGQEKDSEQKHEVLRETLRKAETCKLKAEAKLNMLRNAGINVDQWLDSAYEAIAKEAEIEAQMKQQQAAANASAGNEELQASHAMNSFDSFDDTFEGTLNEDTPPTVQTPTEATIRAAALYDYQAQRDDELNIREHEYLEIIEESEGDGWVKARNESGLCGYIPEAYVQVERRHMDRQVSSSSDGSPGWPQLTKTGRSHMSSASLNDYEVQAAMSNQTMSASGQTVVCFARALYDYQGCSDDELSFSEGCIIKVLKQDDEGDGFWEGELNGRVGVFPSLLVEELGCPSANEIVTPELARQLCNVPSASCPCLRNLALTNLSGLRVTPQTSPPRYTPPRSTFIKRDMGSILFPPVPLRDARAKLSTVPIYTPVFSTRSKLVSAQAKLAFSQASPFPSQTRLASDQASLFPSQTRLAHAQASLFPSQASLFPSQTRLAPAQASLYPSQARLDPAQAGLFPSQTRLAHAQASLFPSQASLFSSETRLAPDQASLLHSQASLYPSQESLYPSKTRLAHAQAGLFPSQTRLAHAQASLYPSQARRLPAQARLVPAQPLPDPTQPRQCTVKHFQNPCFGQGSRCYPVSPPKRPNPPPPPMPPVEGSADSTRDPIYTEIEGFDEASSSLPPSLPPPPLPDTLPTLSIYTEVERRRPASADITESPSNFSFYPRSAPQSPTNAGFKPARAAPLPPGKVKKKLFEKQEHLQPQPESRYTESPVTMV